MTVNQSMKKTVSEKWNESQRVKLHIGLDCITSVVSFHYIDEFHGSGKWSLQSGIFCPNAVKPVIVIALSVSAGANS